MEKIDLRTVIIQRLQLIAETQLPRLEGATLQTVLLQRDRYLPPETKPPHISDQKVQRIIEHADNAATKLTRMEEKFAGDLQRVLRFAESNEAVRGYQEARRRFFAMVQSRRLLPRHARTLAVLHAHADINQEIFKEAMRGLALIDSAGITACQRALEIEATGVLWAAERGDEVGLTSIRAATTIFDDKKVQKSVIDTIVGNEPSVRKLVAQFIARKNKFKLGAPLAGVGAITCLAFGAWQLFGGEAAQSRTAKIASLGLNALGMIGCSLATPFAVAGTLIGAGSLVMEAREFFKDEDRKESDFSYA